jgi:hypothetical protein
MLETIFTAAVAALSFAVNTVLELFKHLGFIGYWLATMGVLFLDIDTNVLGQLLSLLSKPLTGFEVTSIFLFALALVGGCIWLLYKGRMYLH